MTAHSCLNGGAMGFREPSCVACNEEYPVMTDRPDLAAMPASPRTAAGRAESRLVESLARIGRVDWDPTDDPDVAKRRIGFHGMEYIHFARSLIEAEAEAAQQAAPLDVERLARALMSRDGKPYRDVESLRTWYGHGPEHWDNHMEQRERDEVLAIAESIDAEYARLAPAQQALSTPEEHARKLSTDLGVALPAQARPADAELREWWTEPRVAELLSEAASGPWWRELGVARDEEEHMVWLTNEARDTLMLNADDVAVLVNAALAQQPTPAEGT